MKITVGSQRREFIVHKQILCRSSPYFEKMFNGSFKEAGAASAAFPEHHPYSFEILLLWIYNGQNASSLLSRSDQKIDWSISETYSLADMLQIPSLKDQLVSHLVQDQKRSANLGSLARAYSRTPAGCGLRKACSYLVGFMISSNQGPHTDKDICEAMRNTPELHDDVIGLLRKYEGKVPNPRKQSRCYFHEHEQTYSCPYF